MKTLLCIYDDSVANEVISNRTVEGGLWTKTTLITARNRHGKVIHVLIT